MESNWEEIKRKKNEEFEKELKIFLGKLDKIRSNRISLTIIRGLMIANHKGVKKPLKEMANLSISSSHELIIQPFEAKLVPAITKAILDNPWGYKLVRNTKQEIAFALLPLTKEIRENLIQEVKKITEQGKISFRLIHQDIKKYLKKLKNFSQEQKKNYEKQGDKLIEEYQNKLLVAEREKIRELNS